MMFFMSTICVWCSCVLYYPDSPHAKQGVAKSSVVPTLRWQCHSQCLYPLLRGGTERFGGGQTSRSLLGSDCHKMKMFFGRIATVSEYVGRSVTVSKRRVD